MQIHTLTINGAKWLPAREVYKSMGLMDETQLVRLIGPEYRVGIFVGRDAEWYVSIPGIQRLARRINSPA